MTDLDYTTLKQFAKENKRPVTDLLALAPQNDPFYVGTKSDLVMAKWFKALWDEAGYDTGVHLRRMHYRLDGLHNVKLPRPITWTDKKKGSPTEGKKLSTDIYINNLACWSYLCTAGKAARYLGMISAEAFVDRRNPEAKIYSNVADPASLSYEDPEPGQEINGGWETKEYEWETDDNDRFSLPDLPQLDDLPSSLPTRPGIAAKGYEGQPQKYLVEIWCEKSTMNDELIPLCQRYGINLITGLGEMSITSVVDYLSRVKDYIGNSDRGLASRILYISDYDPAGLGMPISVSRKIEFYLSLLQDEGYDIALKPIILNLEQVKKYELPRAPVKNTDKRKDSFEAIHGEATELDALEALHPGVFREIVETEISNYYDYNWRSKLSDKKREVQELLDIEAERIYEDYDLEIEEVEENYEAIQEKWQGIMDKFAELVKPFQTEIETCRAELEDITERIKETHSEIEDELGDVEVDYPELPEAALPDEPNGLLFNSNRDYFDQLFYYQEWRAGSNGK